MDVSLPSTFPELSLGGQPTVAEVLGWGLSNPTGCLRDSGRGAWSSWLVSIAREALKYPPAASSAEAATVQRSQDHPSSRKKRLSVSVTSSTKCSWWGASQTGHPAELSQQLQAGAEHPLSGIRPPSLEPCEQPASQLTAAQDLLSLTQCPSAWPSPMLYVAVRG